MILKASDIGELAVQLLSREGPGEVTRVFPRSLYLRSGDDFLLLLWGPLKSPMTVNMQHGKAAGGAFDVGQRVKLRRGKIESDTCTIDGSGGKVHRSSLLAARMATLPTSSELVKGVTILKSLYDVAPQGPVLPGDASFAAFVEKTLLPFAGGRDDVVFRFQNYLGLVGRGGGFTPAGDDFVAGFVGTFNFLSRCNNSRAIVVPKESVLSRTVPESGAIIVYSSRGYVDEGLERLILASTSAYGTGFSDELLSVASRGHTSGVDMSLGVLLCEAAAADRTDHGNALRLCLRALRER